MNASEIINGMRGTPPSPPPTALYNSGRFPYTYAYDYMRLCGIASSRRDAARKLTMYCEEQGLERQQAAESLAFAYMDHYGIVA